MDPLPELRTGNLGGGRIFHQPIDGDRPVATRPCIHILQRHADVVPQAGFGNLTLRHRQQVVGSDPYVGYRAELVVARKRRLENIQHWGYQSRMGNPRAVKSLVGLPLLVGLHLRESGGVGGLVVPSRYERGHPAQGVGAATVARVHQQLGRRRQEVRRHRNLRPVGKHHVGPLVEHLDDAENVVPAPQVEARRSFAQLVQDFFHLESGQNMLNQDRRADGAARHIEAVFSIVENVVPEARFQVGLQLRQIVIGTSAVALLRHMVMVYGEAKIEEAAGNLLPIHQHVPFHQVQTARAHAQGRGLFVELILPPVGSLVADGAAVGVSHVELAIEGGHPGRRVGVLKIGHVNLRPAVQSVDDHAPV